MRTWKVIDKNWDDSAGIEIQMACPRCGNAAILRSSRVPESPIIATMGLCIVFDNPSYVPPTGWLPTTVECRSCGTIFSSED